eukprot:s475_g14.t1
MQLTRYHTDIALKDDERIQKRKREFARELDRSNSNKQAFAGVRGPGLPRVFEIGKHVTFAAMIVPDIASRQHMVYADADDVARISLEYPVSLGDQPAKVLEIHDHHFLVETKQEVSSWEEETTVDQHQFAIAPGDIAKQLSQYWQPIWNRDEANLDFVDAPLSAMDFHDMLGQIPPHPEVQVDMTNQEAWTKALKKLKAKSARGTDLISAQELKMLPWHLMKHLARVLSLYQEGFPADFMHGLICPLSKTDEIPRADQTRPITLLPQIYRLWSAVVTYQITRVLCAWIPNDVTGLLPQRGATTIAYMTQYAIEDARRRSNLCAEDVDWFTQRTYKTLASQQ